jgi:hypothetical protein
VRPNMRVQRTRSSPSAPHSPLTRKPLGRPGIIVAIAAMAICLAAGCKDSPTEPLQASSLTGTWSAGHLALCVGDWSSVRLELTQSGTDLSGSLTTHDGQVFPVAGSFSNETGSIGLTIGGDCPSVGFAISHVEHDGSGSVTRFSGQLTGRCCNTVIQQYELVRTPAA